MDRIRTLGEIDGGVMFKPIVADVLHQPLHVGNLYYAVAAKSAQGIIRQFAFSEIGNDFCIQIVRRNPQIRKGAGLDAADDRAIGRFLANCTGND